MSKQFLHFDLAGKTVMKFIYTPTSHNSTPEFLFGSSATYADGEFFYVKYSTSLGTKANLIARMESFGFDHNYNKIETALNEGILNDE
jgi:hypothetical protein